MCVSLLVASLVVTAAGTAMSIDNANYQAGMTKLQLNEQREQMLKEQANVRLQAQEAEVARLEEYRLTREANLLALAGSGVGQSMSFMQGIEQASDKALRRDLANIRIGRIGNENRIAQQIRVNRTQLAVSEANRRSAVIGAGLKLAGSMISAGNIYGQTRTPGGKAPSSGGGNTGGSNIAPARWYVPGGGGPMPIGG